MPVVLEESETPDDAKGSDERSSSVDTSLTSKLSRDVSADSERNRSQSEPTLSIPLSENQSPEAKQSYRRLSDGVHLQDSQVTRSPHLKLTFINGQFLDLMTAEGKEMASSAIAAESGVESTRSGVRRNEICGIEASIYAGHGGILDAARNSGKPGKPDSESARDGRKRLNSWGMTRAASNASHGSEASAKTFTTKGSNATEDSRDVISKDSVTSILTLGEGYFLTASKYDRVIKMWRATDTIVAPTGLTTKTHIEFIREFVGHNTGVTCLTRVDIKGRFLSASKDCSVILWDSRYNCDDDEALDEENRTILARFENMDQRALKSIAMTQEGSYVRLTDNIDFEMLKAAARKTVTAGSAGLQQAAREKHIIACTCRFASITGHHNSVKIWSIQHSEDQNGIEAEENCAEVTMDQELKSDIVVESLTAALGKGIILTGDRMGYIKLWRGGRGLLDPRWTWTCERIFTWKKRTDLCSVGDAMNFAVSSIKFLSDDIFVSGYRGGILRLWKVESDKDLVSINGAHNDEIVDIQLGCFEEKNEDKRVSFASASSDGKVLSFTITMGKTNKGKPLCYNVVYHGIACRYLANRDSVSVKALECVDILNTTTLDYRKAMISVCSTGNINILKAQLAPDSQSQDALLLYRKQIEEEALTLHAIVADMLNAIEVRDRKKKVFIYKQCFLGR